MPKSLFDTINHTGHPPLQTERAAVDAYTKQRAKTVEKDRMRRALAPLAKGQRKKARKFLKQQRRKAELAKSIANSMNAANFIRTTQAGNSAEAARIMLQASGTLLHEAEGRSVEDALKALRATRSTDGKPIGATEIHQLAKAQAEARKDPQLELAKAITRVAMHVGLTPSEVLVSAKRNPAAFWRAAETSERSEEKNRFLR